MSSTGSGDDPAASLERQADQLEHHLEELDDHIADAQKAAAARREDAFPEDAAGDWKETRGAPGQGEDPEGAIGEHGAGEGATERDATSDEASSGDDASAGTDDGAGGDREDPIGSRMPGHPSGGDD